jgi:hypothetical protein
MQSGHVMPQPYANAQYTLFKTGTKSNATHSSLAWSSPISIYAHV